MEIYDVFYFNGAVAMAFFSVACFVFIVDRIVHGVRCICKDLLQEFRSITDEY